MNEQEEDEEGIPIYLDPLDRTLVDAAGEFNEPSEWHPSNGAANRLIKCQEALNDIQEILEGYSVVKSSTKRRRRLRAIFVPLHSLCVAMIELMNQIQSDKGMHDRLPQGATSRIAELKTYFVGLVPFDRKGKLGKLRNKVSAHYERSMSPAEMRDLLNTTDSTEVGEWIHISIGVLCDLLKLDAYSWQADGPNEGMITAMHQEPVITVWNIENSTMTGIAGMFMSKKSPKRMFFEVLSEISQSSQCLFERASDYRISGFYQDEKEDWARSLGPDRA